MKKSKLKKLIQIPLKFHHQDIHDRLDEIIQFILNLKALLVEVKTLLEIVRSEKMTGISKPRASYSVPEPKPVPNDNPSIHDLVIADIEDRKKFGVEKYGTLLQAGNGRKSLVDLYQELIDAACYCRLLIEEENNA